jgi:hypothetical protein
VESSIIGILFTNNAGTKTFVGIYIFCSTLLGELFSKINDVEK